MRRTIATIVIAITLSAHAEPAGQLIFSDDFSRKESTPDKEDIGNGWTTNSAWRAPGKKQVTLKDGIVIAGTSEGASHNLVLFHPAGLRDGSVEVKFKIGEKQDFSVEFADPKCTSVHAGHLAQVRIGGGQLSISDTKTGAMNLKLRERRLALPKGQQDAELDALLKSKQKNFPAPCQADEWHTLLYTVNADTLSAMLDGKEIGSFSSEGFAHPDKAEIRINIAKHAEIDSVKIWKLN